MFRRNTNKARGLFAACLIGDGALLVECAQTLLDGGHKISGIISHEPAIREWAQAQGIENLSPDDDMLAFLQGRQFDHLFSIYNFSLLSDDLLSTPSGLAINYHDGPLPQYAGFFVTSWALLNGAKSFGITWHLMTDAADGGPVVAQTEIEIDQQETAFSLNLKCYRSGLETFADLVAQLADGTVSHQAQTQDKKHFYSRYLRPQGGGILSWESTAEDLARMVRALDFGPVANSFMTPKVFLNGKYLVPKHPLAVPLNGDAPAGSLVAIDTHGFTVATLDGALQIGALTTLNGRTVEIDELGIHLGDCLPSLKAAAFDGMDGLYQKICRHEVYWLKKLIDRSTCSLGEAGVHREVGDPFLSVHKRDQEIIKFTLGHDISALEKTLPDRINLGETGELTFALWSAFFSFEQNSKAGIGLCVEPVMTIDPLASELFSPVVPFTVQVPPEATLATFVEQFLILRMEAAKHCTYSRDIWLRQPELTAMKDSPFYSVIIERITQAEGHRPPLLGPLLLGISDNGLSCICAFDSTQITVEFLQAMLARFTRFISSVAHASNQPLSNCFHCAMPSGGDTEDQKRLAEWQEIYNQVYATTHDQAGSFTNTACWISSFTGEPLPPDHMEEWLGYTVDAIRGIDPRRILEIGCGTGLLLSRLAYYSDSYVATDFSHQAILSVRRDMPALGVDGAKVTLLEQPAHDFSNIPGASFDTAILNSVVQYFPSLDYLNEVLAELIQRTPAGGNIFIGDVRSLPLRDAFHLAIALAELSHDDNANDLRRVMQARAARDTELSIDPSFFHTLSERHAEISAVKIELKRGQKCNELTQFRYDVTLSIGPVTESKAVAATWHWQQEGLSLESLKLRLLDSDCSTIALAGIPNHRVTKVTATLSLLDGADKEMPVGQLLTKTDHIASKGIEPELIRQLACGLGYDTIISPSLTAGADVFDALLSSPSASATSFVRTEYPQHRSVHQLFVDQVHRTPQAVAVIYQDSQLTYQALNHRSDMLAHALRQRRIGTGDYVGVCLERSIDMLAAMLGIMKSGAAYVPLDPEFPVDRLAHMVADAGLQLVIAPTAGHSRTPWVGIDVLDPELVETDAITDTVSHEQDWSVDPTTPAYVIYTSGSTGQPKGVRISHASLTNFIWAMKHEPGFTSSDRLLALTTISFDIAALELFTPLIAGGCVEIAPLNVARDGILLKQTIDIGDCSVIQATPTTWQMLLAARWQGNPELKLLCGGEALSRKLADQLIMRCGELWNLYGPTETTVWSTAARVLPGEPVTIGHPIANTLCVVVDEALNPVADGKTGELLIGGDGVAIDYLDKPELTADRFISRSILAQKDFRLYRTGDLACRLPDGRLLCLGRLDSQIKLNGYRIELEEVRAAILKLAGVREAVVVLRKEHDAQRLVAFYSADPEGSISADSFHAQLSVWLPAYMIPSAFHGLREFPQTPNRKIAHKSLAQDDLTDILSRYSDHKHPPAPRLTPASTHADTHKQKTRNLAQIILQATASVAKVDAGTLDVDVHLGRYGLNSVRFTSLCLKLNDQFATNLTPTLFYKHSTAQALAEYLLTSFPEKFHTANAKEAPPKVTSNPQSRAPGRQQDMHNIAIIGIGGRLPGGDTLEEFWHCLADAEDLISVMPETRWDASWAAHYDNRINGGFIKKLQDFDAGFFGISPREAEWMDPRQRLLLETVWQTIENSGHAQQEFDGSATGVFIGAASSDYWELQRDQNRQIDAYTLSGFSNSVLSNRLSFWFNLHGPSATIDTACSSSMIALVRAVTAIRQGQCDMAIAAGVNAIISPHFHRCLEAGGYLSPAARCKSFAVDGDGYVRGEGVAAVLLKPLAQAQADGDNIHGIIRGVAENHGGRSNSLSAPDQSAQTELICSAFRDAAIDPATVSYIETHGTGTHLGDPIEINALKDAFEQLYGELDLTPPSEPHCGLGALKTNIGHLEAGAGIAGLIKLVLSLKHKTLPGLLHLKTLNPYIKLDDTPFYLVRETMDWQCQMDAQGEMMPRRAGLSSFGFGGANGHVIVEEFVPGLPAFNAAADESNLFVLSAHTEKTLQQMAANLADHLVQESDIHLADVAFTLQQGRNVFAERLAIVANGSTDLVNALRAFAAGQSHVGHYRGHSKQSVILDFLSDDHHGRHFLTGLVARKELTKLARLWVIATDVDWSLLWNKGANRVALPTYPFDRQHYWLPAETSAGSGERIKESLHPLLQQHITTGDASHFSTKLHGTEFFLADHVIEGDKILPAVALMEMAREAGSQFKGQAVRTLWNLVWMRPVRVANEILELKINVIPAGDGASFEITTVVDGQSLIHGQGRLSFAKDADNLIAPVIDLEAVRKRCRPAADVQTLYQQLWRYGLHLGESYRPMETVWLGKGEALSAMRLPVKARPGHHLLLHPSLMDGALQTVLCGIWDVTEQPLHVPFSVGEVEIFEQLPEQCFAYATPATSGGIERVKKFDVQILNHAGQVLVHIHDFMLRPGVSGENTVTGAELPHCFRPSWVPAPLPLSAGNAHARMIVMFGFDEVWQAALRTHLPIGSSVTLVRPGKECCKMDGDAYFVRPDNIEDYRFMLAELEKSGVKPDHILYSAMPIDHPPSSFAWASGLIVFLQALSERRKPGQNMRLLYLPNAAHGMEAACQHAASGLLRTLALEQSGWNCQVLSLPSEDVTHPTRVIDLVINEWCNEHHSPDVRYQGGIREVQQFEPIALEAPDVSPFKAGGVYWITGGSGALGMIVARHMAAQTAVKLVLTGRSPLNDQSTACLDELKAMGAQAIYIQADLAEPTDVKNALATIHAQFGAVSGVLHGAGVIRDAYLSKKDITDLGAVLGGKIAGAWNLDTLLKDEPLDFMVVFSSIAGAIGNAGQSDYALANSFLDHFARWRNTECLQGRRSGKTFAINWPLWRDGGMHVDEATARLLLQTLGMAPLETAAGLTLLEAALCSDYAQIFAMAGNKKRIMRTLGLADEVTKKITPEIDTTTLSDVIESELIKMAAQILKIAAEKFDPDRDMSQYGFESLSFTEFANHLNADFDLDITPALFFEHPTLRSLIDYLASAHGSAFASRVEQTSMASTATKPSPKSDQETAAPVLEPIAVIGMSATMPGAADCDSFWQHLVNGDDMVSEIPPERWDWHAVAGNPEYEVNKSNSRWGGFIDAVDMFDARFFGISPHEAALMDPQHRLFLQACYGAVEDAGILISAMSGSKTGLFVGVATRDYAELIQQHNIPIEAHISTGNAPSILANRVSYLLNLSGPSEPIDTACSSSLVAIQRGVDLIRSGACEMALAGGVNVMLTPTYHISFSKAGMLSPDGRCKTFDASANGYVRGEGVGVVLLKSLSRALADGDPIHAVIRGTAVNHGGHANSLTAPNPIAQAELLVSAYENATIDPATVTYMEAHGTGTTLGDPVEINGLKKAFSALFEKAGREMPTQPYCGLGTVKSNIGHLEAAAGIAGVIKVILAMQHGVLPESLHVKNLNPYINIEKSPFFILREQQHWQRLQGSHGGRIPRRAGVSSFGYGGANAHVVLEEAPKAAPTLFTNQDLVFVLSAKSGAQVKAYALALVRYLDVDQRMNEPLVDIAHTLLIGREAMAYRLALIAADHEQLRERLLEFVNGDSESRWHYQGSVGAATDFAVAQADIHSTAEAWVHGVEVDLTSFYDVATARRIHLPTYPFAKRRHWLEIPDKTPTPYPATNIVKQFNPSEPKDLETFIKAHAVLEELCPWWLFRALHEGDLLAKTKPGIHPDHYALWDLLLNTLEEAGFIQQKNGLAVVINPAEKSRLSIRLKGLEKEINRLTSSYPMIAMHVNLLRVCLDSYPDILRGHVAATEVLFPESSMQRVEVIYRGHPEADCTNRFVADAVLSYVQHHRGSGTPLRILEIGAGTGSTTREVLRALAPHGAEIDYLYTDVSPAFTDHGRSLFAATYPFIQFKLLNLEEDLRSQGVAAGSFDVVIAANVIHATQSIENTLSNLQRVLKPGGWLVMNELIRTTHFTTLTFGLLKGWWLFTDKTLRIKGSPLLNIASWRNTLGRAGFQNIEIAGADHALSAQLIQHVLVAENSAAIVTETHSQEVNQVRELLTEIVGQALKLNADEVEPDTAFAELGLDSILLSRLNSGLKKHFGPQSKSIALEYPSINLLAARLATEPVADRVETVLPNENSSDTNTESASAPVAIIGMSGRYPGAATLEQFWENLKSGRRSISVIPPNRWDVEAHFNPDKQHKGTMYSKWGGFLADIEAFDPLFFGITPLEAKEMNPEERLLLETVWSTLEDAGYTPQSLLGKTVGVFIGANSLAYSLRNKSGHAAHHAVDSTAYHLPNRISYFCNFSGPSLAVDTACSSSLTAVHMASESIRHGECDLAVAGGINLYLHPSQYQRLCELQLLSSSPEPSLFDPDGDGFAPGEGVGAVLLKPLADAVHDRDHIHGIIRASVLHHKGRNENYLLPSPHSQQAALTKVIQASGINPQTISSVEAQALGSAMVDSAEWAAFNQVFGEFTSATGYCAYSSVKPNIGHLETAAGMAQLTKVLLQMKHGQLVPCLVADNPDPAIKVAASPFRLPTETEPWEKPRLTKDADGHALLSPRRAIISSFGAGGVEAYLVLEEAPAHHSQAKTGCESEQLILFSAKNAARLSAVLMQFHNYLSKPESSQISLGDIAFTLQSGREAHDERFAVIAKNKAHLNELLSDQTFEHAPQQGRFRGRIDKHAAPPMMSDADLASIYRSHNLSGAAAHWVNGGAVDWQRLDPLDTARRVALPTYPFEQRFCWHDTQHAAVAKNDLDADAANVMVSEYYDSLFATSTGDVNDDEVHLTFAPLVKRPPGFSWVLTYNQPELYAEHATLLREKQREAKAVSYRHVDFNQVNSVLDIGCGLGADLIELGLRWPHLRGCGYTLAPKQAQSANERIARAGLADRFQIFCGDSTKVTHQSDYDLVIGFEVMPHVKAKQAAFNNIANCLRRDGNLLLADSVAGTVTEIELPHLAMFTSTCKQYSQHLANAGLQLVECVDLSTEIANFLEDDNFEANLAQLSLATKQADAFQEEHRSWFNFGQAVRKGLLRYVLLTVSTAPPDMHPDLLVAENCKAFEVPVRYPDALLSQPEIMQHTPDASPGADGEPQLIDLIDTLGEAELDHLLERLSCGSSVQ